jgi:hypothetical protein
MASKPRTYRDPVTKELTGVLRRIEYARRRLAELDARWEKIVSRFEILEPVVHRNNEVQPELSEVERAQDRL